MKGRGNTSFILKTARALKKRLNEQAIQLGQLMPDYDHRLGRTVRSISDFAVCTAPSDAGFFYNPKTKVMLLNAASVNAIILRVKSFIESTNGPSETDPELAEEMRRFAVEIFILHELCHFAQGIANFEDVQAVKATEGPTFLAKLDLTADKRAAEAWSWMKTLERGLPASDRFQYHFLDALTFMCATCVPAFGLSMDKPAKVSRALGLYLMLSRAWLLEEGFMPAASVPSFPLDTPIFPSFSADWSSMTLIALTPEIEIKVAGFPVEADFIGRFVARASEGDFFQAAVLAGELAKQVLSAIAKSQGRAA